MRHQCKRHQLGRPKDQREAVLRSLASSLIMHDEIKTTMPKAKALRPYVEHLVSLAKRGDLHARRQAKALIYDQPMTESYCAECQKEYGLAEVNEENKCECGGKLVQGTVLRKLFARLGKDHADRQGGYTRIFRLPPRRGDNAEMALIQFV